MAKPRYRSGWGDCPYCRKEVGATSTGLAVRHGFIRIKHGITRTALPHLKSGRDHKACPGSGQPLENWYDPRKEAQKG